MKIIIAKNAGFCGGVRRAYELVKRELHLKAPKRSSNVFILGSLVHNEGVSQEVESWGIQKIKNLRPVKKGDVLIITAHGAPKEVYEKITQKGAKIFDATCPKVSLIHKIVKRSCATGTKVVVFGDKKHKEVKGILSWAGKKAEVIKDLKEAKEVWKRLENKAKKEEKLLLVSQTTQPFMEFDKVKEFFKSTNKSQNS